MRIRYKQVKGTNYIWMKKNKRAKSDNTSNSNSPFVLLENSFWLKIFVIFEKWWHSKSTRHRYIVLKSFTQTSTFVYRVHPLLWGLCFLTLVPDDMHLQPYVPSNLVHECHHHTHSDCYCHNTHTKCVVFCHCSYCGSFKGYGQRLHRFEP